MDTNALCIVSSYLLDLIFGDPHWVPHPVKGVGRAIQKLESPLRRMFAGHERTGGGALAALTIGGAFFVTWAAVQTAGYLHPYLKFGVSVFFIYTALATRDLQVESMRVYRALKKKNWAEARKQLAMIVGRDTQSLDEKEMVRATVETIAENITDAIVSPLFYAFIGGAPLAMAYKAVNTLDSMVGYKNERYRNFGWASARIDDVANYVPARITAFLLPIAAWCCGKNGYAAWRIILRDGHKNPSPNSGIPEAGMAGALGVRLGGLNFYAGQPACKPYIGEACKSLALDDIKDAIKIMYATSVFAVLFGVAIKSLW